MEEEKLTKRVSGPERSLTRRERRTLAKEEKRKIRERSELVKRIRNWFIGLLVIVALSFGGYKIIQWVNTPQPEISEEDIKVAEDEWIKGNPEGQITLIEYSDFQCPACKNFSPLIARLAEEFSDEVRIVYRQFPLTSVHRHAMAAAKATEAAGKQGKFWEMHDILFEKQDEWASDSSPEDKFEGYVNQLGLDADIYKSDYESSEVEEEVNRDISTANRLGLNSTPSFVLNGRIVEAPKGYDALKQLIEDEIRGYSLEQ